MDTSARKGWYLQVFLAWLMLALSFAVVIVVATAEETPKEPTIEDLILKYNRENFKVPDVCHIPRACREA